MEFAELADHTVSAKHFGNAKDQVGGGDTFGEFAGEFDANDLRDEHEDGLAEHDGFSFDAAHAPTDDAQAVDHGGVTVGADQ